MSKQSKQQGTAEALLHTENDHWNEYALRFLVKVKEGIGPNVRIKVDDRDQYSPGWKYNEYEMRPMYVTTG